MPDDRHSTNDDAILAVPGVLFVGAPASGRSGLRVGPDAGWMVPRGIAQWERELSFVPRARMTPELAGALHATLADEQIAPKRFPMAKRAVEMSPLLALSGGLVDEVRAQGVRVHTVGVDRVSGDFFYFEEGGEREGLRVQGNLVEMLAPSIGSSNTNAELAAALEGLLDRLLLSLSGGVVSELGVELADALPRLSRDGTGMLGTDLAAFEAQANALSEHSERWEVGARRILRVLDDAARKGLRSAQVPLFGEARQEERPALEVLIAGKTVKLAGPRVWTVTGKPQEDATPAPAQAPVAEPRPAVTQVRAQAQASASPAPAKSVQSPAPPRVASAPALAGSSPAAAPSPAPPRVPPSPVPARPSPTPAPSRIVVIGPEPPAATEPTPLRFTPVPPRPDPVAPRAAVAPAPEPARVPAPAVEPMPAVVPEPAAASAAAPEGPPASPPSPEVASTPSSTPSPEPALPSSPRPELAPSSRTATTARPPRPAPKRSPSTLVLALIAIAALAYVALERFMH